MSQQTMEAHYAPNWRLTQAHGLLGYNCGYAESPGCATFDEHQQALVWQLLGDTPITSATTILDVGCGIGGPSGWMFHRFQPRRLIGLEYLATSAAAAEGRWANHAPRPWFTQGDAHDLPFADNSIDVIFNLESALHYRDKDAFLAQCARVLRPGGVLCLGDITNNLEVVFQPIKFLNKLPTEHNPNVYLWSTEQYENAFERVGLEPLWYEEASRHVAHSLADGRRELNRLGFFKTLGFRKRMFFLEILEDMLQGAELRYDLFRVRKPDGTPAPKRAKAAAHGHH